MTQKKANTTVECCTGFLLNPEKKFAISIYYTPQTYQDTAVPLAR